MSDDATSVFSTPFACRKQEHMAEARLSEGTPLSPIGITLAVLGWREVVIVYLVRYRKWKPALIGEFRRFLSTTTLTAYSRRPARSIF